MYWSVLFQTAFRLRPEGLFCDRNVRNRARAQSAGRCSYSYSLFRIADLCVPHHFFEHEHRFAEHEYEYENCASSTGSCLIPLKPARLETLLRRDKEGGTTRSGPPWWTDLRQRWSPAFTRCIGVPPGTRGSALALGRQRLILQQRRVRRPAFPGVAVSRLANGEAAGPHAVLVLLPKRY